ncbi:MAG: AMP-binding protein, partial [Schwartzia sp.]|nr:AMP-binding protein [Schwartzia sp. (in: firmicutes)]
NILEEASRDRTPKMPEQKSLQERMYERQERQAAIDRDKEARRLKMERLGTGIADLSASIGDMIRAHEGAPVSPRDWQRIYDSLTAQEKANINNYQVRMAKLNEDRRQERMAAAKAAADAQKAAQEQATKMAIEQAKITSNEKIAGDRNTTNIIIGQGHDKARKDAAQIAADAKQNGAKPVRFTAFGQSYDVLGDERSFTNMMNDILAGKPEILFIVPLFVQTLYNAFRKFLKAKGLADKIDAMIAENNRKGNVTAAEKRAMFAEVLTFFGGRLSRIVSGGAPLDMESCNGFADFGITVLNGYGITECSPVLAVNPVVNNKPESVGKVIKSLEVKIENPDENGYGEICAKGSSIMLGYYKNDAENAKSLIDGWFHTGDKGWMDDEDYLYICGRIKNLIILANGENVSPEEIEGFIYQQIKAVAEVVVYDKNGHITAQIFKNDDYIQENGIEDAENYIRDAISALNLKLAIYKRIAEVEFRDTPFDKTTSKKIKRRL